MRVRRWVKLAGPRLFAYWSIRTVHPNPIPALAETYRSTLSLVQESLPATSPYRQSVEALTQHRLAIVETAEHTNAVDKVEKEIGQGQIEEVIVAAKNELNLVAKMTEWKAYAKFHYSQSRLLCILTPSLYSWEPLEARPAPGQWDYFK